MNLLHSFRRRARNPREDDTTADIMAAIRDLRSCDSAAYYEDVGEAFSKGEILIKDSILNRSTVALRNVTNLIVTVESFEGQEALESINAIRAGFETTRLEYERLTEELKSYSNFASELLGDVASYDILSTIRRVSTDLAEEGSRQTQWLQTLQHEIMALEAEKNDLETSIGQLTEEIARLKQRTLLAKQKREQAGSAGKEKLNERQTQAANHVSGPLLITAGPGSGKTRLIEERATHLVDHGCGPDQILALTFTVKAAESLKSRLFERLGHPSDEPSVSNFHSFCRSIVLKHHDKLGFKKPPMDLEGTRLAFFILSNLERFEQVASGDAFIDVPSVTLDQDFFKQLIMVNEQLHSQIIRPETALEHLVEDTRHWRDEPAASEKPPTEAEIVKEEEAREKLRQYLNATVILRGVLRDHSFITFGDQINMSLELLREKSDVMTETTERYRHLMVDEFQDNDKAQGELVKLLGDYMESVCVVGDVDQAIYGFRGAHIRNTEVFRENYHEHPQFEHVTLDTGYRYGEPLMEMSESYIAAVRPEDISRREPMRSARPTAVPTPVEYIEAPDAITEAEAIARRIEVLFMAGYDASDIAILSYSLNYLDDIIVALEERGIPFITTAPGSIFRENIVRDTAMLLRAVLDPIAQDLPVRHIMQLPVFGISELDRLRIVQAAGTRPVMGVLHGNLPDGLQDAAAVKSFTDFLTRRTRDEDTGTDLKWAQTVLIEGGIFRRLLVLPPRNPAFRAFNLLMRDFEEFTRTFGESTGAGNGSRKPVNAKLATYLEFLQHHNIEENAEPGITADAVYLSTIHKAKGLEFPVVIMPQLISRRGWSDPNYIQTLRRLLSPELDREIEDENERMRLFFVGMTRAKDRLYLTRPVTTMTAKGDQRTAIRSPQLAALQDNATTPLEPRVIVEPVPRSAGKPLKPQEERYRQLSLELANRLDAMDVRNLRTHLQTTLRTTIEMKLAQAFVAGVEVDEETLNLIERIAAEVGRIDLERPSRNLWKELASPDSPVPEFNAIMSFSAISQFQKCPLQFRLSRLERLVVPKAPIAVTGSNIHRVLEVFTERYHPGGTLEELMGLVDEVWAEARYSDEVISHTAKEEACRKLRNWYEREMARPERPVEIEVEKKFRIQRRGIEIIGFIDRVEKFADERWELVDFKTGGEKKFKKIDRVPVDDDIAQQLVLYYYGCRDHWDVTPSDLAIENVGKGNNRVSLGTIQDWFLEKYRIKIDETLDRIKEGHFEATPEKQVCKWCDYREVCDEKDAI